MGFLAREKVHLKSSNRRKPRLVETQLETLQGNYEQDFRIWEQKEP